MKEYVIVFYPFISNYCEIICYLTKQYKTWESETKIWKQIFETLQLNQVDNKKKIHIFNQ
jgi:hypothetical protein